MAPRLGPIAPTHTFRFRTSLVRFGRNRTKRWQSLANVGRSQAEAGSESVDVDPRSVDILGQVWSNSGQPARIRPKLTWLGPIWPSSTRIRPRFGDFDRIWPDSRKHRPGIQRVGWPLFRNADLATSAPVLAFRVGAGARVRLGVGFPQSGAALCVCVLGPNLHESWPKLMFAKGGRDKSSITMPLRCVSSSLKHSSDRH